MKRLLFVACFAASLAFGWPAPLRAETIAASALTNPPPAEPLGAFDRLEVRPVVLPERYAKQKANVKATVKLQEHLDQKLATPIAEWNGRAARGEPPRVLLIEPRVEKIKFIGGGARFWAGALAGKSALLMRVRLTDRDSGALVAEPEFYQHAAAMSGAWSVGGADNAMLARTTSMIVEYLEGNRDQAVGGPTGMEAPKSN